MASPSKYQAALTLFRQKAPGIIDKLMGDFPIGLDDAFAILGNIGHECFGFTLLQEVAPIVKGSRGGWGWCQWTGPRRRDFEAYCRRTGKDPASDAANYAWLWVELKGAESAALGKLLKAPGLEAKTIAFSRAFLRPGIAHEDSRIQWARVAQSAYATRGSVPANPTPVSEKSEMIAAGVDVAKNKVSKAAAGTSTAAFGGAAINAAGIGTFGHATAAEWMTLGLGIAAIAAIAFGAWWLVTRKARRTAKALETVSMQEGAGQ